MKTSLEDILSSRGKLLYRCAGNSMRPLIRSEKDAVVIVPLRETPPKKGDIVLYKRGDRYVLHRIMKVEGNQYVLCGDNQWYREKGVRLEQMLGLLAGIVRDGKQLSLDGMKYRVYCFFWCTLFHLRCACLFVRDASVFLWRKMIEKMKKR